MQRLPSKTSLDGNSSDALPDGQQDVRLEGQLPEEDSPSLSNQRQLRELELKTDGTKAAYHWTAQGPVREREREREGGGGGGTKDRKIYLYH